MPKIVTLTMNPTIDKSTSVESVASEIKLRCDAPQFDPGGGGINVSRAIKKLDGDSLAAYVAGGRSGERLGDLLKRESIALEPIPVAAFTRENMTVYEESSGLQYRFGMPGPTLTEAEWHKCLDVVMAQNADYIVGSGSLPPGVPDDFYAQLAERAQDTTSRVIIDTSGLALEALAQSHVFLMKPNLREIELLSGESFTDEVHLIDIAQRLISEGMAEVLVISMGASGALFVTQDQSVMMRPPVVPIQSKVGAGDSMVGGIVWSLAKGDDLDVAVRYGIAAGSAAVMTKGTELCRREDVLRIYDRIAVVG